MRIFLVLDNSINRAKLRLLAENTTIKSVVVFPYTSNPETLKSVKDIFEQLGVESVSIIESSVDIQRHVDHVRENICRWSAEIGERRIKGKSIKEWFFLPRYNVSTWWFSMLSEKNPSEANAFLHIAQVRATSEALKTGEYDLCVIALAHRSMQHAISGIARMLNIKAEVLPSPSRQGLVSRIRYFLEAYTPGLALHAIMIWGKYIRRRITATKVLGGRNVRLKHLTPDSLLFVSYFPAADQAAADKGIFINKYAPALQEKIRKMNIPVTWLFVYVHTTGFSYKDAVRMAERFQNKNESLFFIEEFLNIKDLFLIFYLWVKQAVLASYLLRTTKSKEPLSGRFGRECEPIIDSLWKESFLGYKSIIGVFYYFLFARVFQSSPEGADCLYYCEMRAWEKALNAAKNNVAPSVRTIGFQHAHVSRNHFFYFYEPAELQRVGSGIDLPLPDVVACNGKLMYARLTASGYPSLFRVEALRYLYIQKLLSAEKRAIKKNILLVAGSVMKEENLAMLSFIKNAFPAAEKFEIWFKGHPLLPFEYLFEELSIDVSRTRCKITHDSIENCLNAATAVFVASSGVAIEALASGCEIIVPVFADAIHMGPLMDFEKYCHKVASVSDLKKVIEKIADGFSLNKVEESRKAIRDYWDLDDSLHRWENLLQSRGNNLCYKGNCAG